jgi:AraC-like DNA-binding protein/mannose-6-phosphate isomerase-like protein (cupin superfamily)
MMKDFSRRVVEHGGNCLFTLLSFKMVSWTISERLMISRKPKRMMLGQDLQVRESAFTGAEIGLTMVGAATATQGFNAVPLTWHSHNNHEVLMLLHGGAAYEFKNGTEMELVGGHMIVVPARVLHRGTKGVRMPSVICAVNFDIAHPATRHSIFTKREMSWIAAQFKSHTPCMYSMSPTLRRMANTLHQMVLEQRKISATVDGTATIRLLVASIILEIARHTSGSHRTSTTNVVKRAKEHIEAHFNKHLLINEVAEEAGCSRAHLFLVFKRETGMSPNDWLQRCRVKAATDLLRTTHRKLEDIATTVGFSSAQYFCQVFRKYTGKTPGQYREK